MALRAYYDTFWTDSPVLSTSKGLSRRVYASSLSSDDTDDMIIVDTKLSILRNSLQLADRVVHMGRQLSSNGQSHILVPSQQTIMNQLSAFCGVAQPRIIFDTLPRWMVSDSQKVIFPFNLGKSIVRGYNGHLSAPTPWEKTERTNFLKSFAFTDIVMNSGCHVVCFQNRRSIKNKIILGISSYNVLLSLNKMPFDSSTLYVQGNEFFGCILQTGEFLRGNTTCSCLNPTLEGDSIYLAVDVDGHKLWLSNTGLSFTLVADDIPKNLLFFAQLFDEGDEVAIISIPAERSGHN